MFIKAIREMSSNYKPRKLPDVGRPKMWLSGLEDLIVDDVHNHLGLPFLNIGERCNISGSLKFKKLMMAGNYGAAMWRQFCKSNCFCKHVPQQIRLSHCSYLVS